jgi:diguanylate cyclase (GGDEF)-like protein
MYGAVLFLDLDNFNTLNDTRGHETGDQLLLQVAERILLCLQPADTLARPGGDEFVIIIEDLSEEAAAAATLARHLASQLVQAIAQPYMLRGMSCIITCSVGICLFRGQETVEHLLKNADMAMYQAKANGRNTLRFFDPDMQAALDKRSALENDLRQALERNELQLFYQPQVDVTGRVLGAEILLRWKHPQRHFISPADFIPLAEETGLIMPIGQWVMAGACQQIAAWADDPQMADLHLSVNVSSVQFRQDDFVDSVRVLLERYAIDSSRLKLELTETLILDDLESVIMKMQALKELGVSCSLDDFGTGYSSLSYLTRLPLDELKIDQSFVSSLPDNRNDAIIVQAIITMGQSLDLTVVAEGVETQAQRDFLEAHGCLVYQGYLYSRPVPLDDFMSALQSSRPPG